MFAINHSLEDIFLYHEKLWSQTKHMIRSFKDKNFLEFGKDLGSIVEEILVGDNMPNKLMEDTSEEDLMENNLALIELGSEA